MDVDGCQMTVRCRKVDLLPAGDGCKKKHHLKQTRSKARCMFFFVKRNGGKECHRKIDPLIVVNSSLPSGKLTRQLIVTIFSIYTSSNGQFFQPANVSLLK